MTRRLRKLQNQLDLIGALESSQSTLITFLIHKLSSIILMTGLGVVFAVMAVDARLVPDNFNFLLFSLPSRTVCIYFNVAAFGIAGYYSHQISNYLLMRSRKALLQKQIDTLQARLALV